MRVIDIVPGTTVDGPGLRTSIYFAGCTHCCPDCHNPHTHSPSAGRAVSVDDLMDIVEEHGFDVTFTGGDPMFQAEAILPLAQALVERGFRIWCYTGYTYEQVMASRSMRRLLDYIDVLVDGPFITSLRDTGLRFRGSSNQRLVDVIRSKMGAVVEYEDMF